MPCAVAAVLAAALPAGGAFEFSWPDARTASLAGCECASVDFVAYRGRDAEREAPQWAFELSAGELFGLRDARGWRMRVSRADALRLALQATRFGSPLYEERTIGLVIGRSVDDALSLDVGARALGLSADGMADTWTGSLDAGLNVVLLGRIDVAARWENVARATMGGSPVPSTMRLSGALTLDGLLLASSVLIESGFDPSPSLAVEFAPAPGFRVRAGSGTRPGRFAAGVGVSVPRGSQRAGGLSFDAAWEWHPELGVSSFATISLLP